MRSSRYRSWSSGTPSSPWSGPTATPFARTRTLLQLAAGVALRAGQPGGDEDARRCPPARPRSTAARRDLPGQRLQRRPARRRADRHRTAGRRPRRRPAPPPRRARAPSPRRRGPAGRGAAPGAAAWAASSSSSSASGRSEKNCELLVDQPVVELHPVLVELVRRRLGRIEPQPGRRSVLPSLLPSAAVSSGQARAWTAR